MLFPTIESQVSQRIGCVGALGGMHEQADHRQIIV